MDVWNGRRKGCEDGCIQVGVNCRKTFQAYHSACIWPTIKLCPAFGFLPLLLLLLLPFLPKSVPACRAHLASPPTHAIITTAVNHFSWSVCVRLLETWSGGAAAAAIPWDWNLTDLLYLSPVCCKELISHHGNLCSTMPWLHLLLANFDDDASIGWVLCVGAKNVG